MSNANVVVHAAPPAPPGPVRFDFTRFSSNTSVTMVDTQALQLNANVTNTNRLKAYGDPSTPAVPAITTAAVGTSVLAAPCLDANSQPYYKPTLLLADVGTVIVSNVFLQGVMAIGQQRFTAPPFSVLTSPTIRLHGDTLANAYPFQGGMLVGFAPLFVPQPPFATTGKTYSLNGGVVGGAAPLFH